MNLIICEGNSNVCFQSATVRCREGTTENAICVSNEDISNCLSGNDREIDILHEGMLTAFSAVARAVAWDMIRMNDIACDCLQGVFSIKKIC